MFIFLSTMNTFVLVLAEIVNTSIVASKQPCKTDLSKVVCRQGDRKWSMCRLFYFLGHSCRMIIISEGGQSGIRNNNTFSKERK